jgi:hypothetical protein
LTIAQQDDILRHMRLGLALLAVSPLLAQSNGD